MASWGTRARASAALLVGTFWWAALPAAAELLFALDGETVARRDLPALRETFPVSTVLVHEPYEDRELGFEAVSLAAVLDAVYGSDWRGAADRLLLFTCRDGYQPSVPVARVLAHPAWLAFAREASDGFALQKLESGTRRRVELAPFYLIWENLDDAQIRSEGDYGWPYQLVGIDLVRAEDRFPKMTPPADAPQKTKAGFAAFQIHCSRCHTINGEGGTIGPELNGTPPSVKLRDRAWLARWIDDPSQLLATARMPALAPGAPSRHETIEALIDYLDAMAKAKRDASLER